MTSMNTVAFYVASTQRTIAWVLAAVVIAAMLIYWLFNWLEGKPEIGAEVELAPNRKPQWDDDKMETTRLDMSLTAGLALLGIIALSLPLYWLAEPGRQEGAVEFKEERNVVAGEGLYNENCAQCHGSVDGNGGLRSFSLVDDSGNFVEQVDWKVPSLGGLLYRFSEEETTYILNYGRQNSPMPAWGIQGGGPLTTQQIEHVVEYVAANQITKDEMDQRVVEGLPDAAFDKVLRDDAALRSEYWTAWSADAAANHEDEAAAAALERIEETVEEHAAELVVAANSDALIRGELLFTNPADNGSYGCARCHSAGWSYDADAFVGEASASGTVSVLPAVVHGGGGFGPNLTGGATLRQFDDVNEMVSFIAGGSVDGQKYGNFGQGDGGGQMPAFGTCVGDRDTAERRPLEGHCDKPGIEDGGTLELADLEAIVLWERNLGMPAAPEPASEPTPEPAPEPAPEPEAEPAPTGVVDIIVDTDIDAGTILLDGSVLNADQETILVNAANAEVGAANVTNNLSILDVDAEIEGSTSRVAGLGGLMDDLTDSDLIFAQASLAGPDLAVIGLARTRDAQAAASAAVGEAGINSSIAAIEVDAGSILASLDLSGVQFETSSAILTADSTAILDGAVAELNEFPDVNVEVQGHTDDVGADDANLVLSQARAESVVAYLVGAGIDPARLVATGFGEASPIDDNATPEGRAINRRVQFEVQS